MQRKITIELIKDEIKAFHPNAKLISTKYVNAKTKLTFICEKGHEFSIDYDHLNGRGQWCPQCNLKNIMIGYVFNFLKDTHPKATLLTKFYKNNDSLLEVKCENGHVFDTNWRSLEKNHWCKYCSGKAKKTLKDITDFIEKTHPKARLISTEYKNAFTELDFVCENGHEFKSDWYRLSNGGSWCFECNGKKKLTLEEIQLFLDKNHYGAKLLSKTYINSHKKLHFVCEKGHTYYVSWNSVQSNHWCSKCAGSKGEQLVRKAFEIKFNKPFPKIKPKWLINPKTNYRLELDGFNEELKIAFEYQGMQHYKIISKFKMNQKRLEAQQYRDSIKRQLCKDNNIILIEIKEINNLTDKNIKSAIDLALKERNIMISI